MCGTRTYSVLKDSDNSVVPWAAITGPSSGTYTITFSPNVDNLYTSGYTLKLHAVLASYTSINGNSNTFAVTVNRYVCTGSTTYVASHTMLTTYTFQIGTGLYSFAAPTYYTTPYTCGETITYALSL